MIATTWKTVAGQGSADVALILPGSGYTAQAPLLYWCARLLEGAGWQVRVATWGEGGGADVTPVEFVERSVEDGFSAAEPSTPGAGRRLVVAKSFGTLAAPWAGREGVRGVWLTPILTDEPVAQALAAATRDDLVVGGEADDLWRPERLEGSDACVVTVPGGDHGLLVPGGWRESLAAQQRVYDAVAEHLGVTSSAAAP